MEKKYMEIDEEFFVVLSAYEEGEIKRLERGGWDVLIETVEESGKIILERPSLYQYKQKRDVKAK